MEGDFMVIFSPDKWLRVCIDPNRSSTLIQLFIKKSKPSSPLGRCFCVYSQSHCSFVLALSWKAWRWGSLWNLQLSCFVCAATKGSKRTCYDTRTPPYDVIHFCQFFVIVDPKGMEVVLNGAALLFYTKKKGGAHDLSFGLTGSWEVKWRLGSVR